MGHCSEVENCDKKSLEDFGLLLRVNDSREV